VQLLLPLPWTGISRNGSNTSLARRTLTATPTWSIIPFALNEVVDRRRSCLIRATRHWVNQAQYVLMTYEGNASKLASRPKSCMRTNSGFTIVSDNSPICTTVVHSSADKRAARDALEYNYGGPPVRFKWHGSDIVAQRMTYYKRTTSVQSLSTSH